jgi:hypothetical protein
MTINRLKVVLLNRSRLDDGAPAFHDFLKFSPFIITYMSLKVLSLLTQRAFEISKLLVGIFLERFSQNSFEKR